jgi:hypothetical protein
MLRDIELVVCRPSCGRTLVTRAGRRLDIDPDAYRGGLAAVQALDNALEATLDAVPTLRLPDDAPFPDISV